jgi:uncharacterized protein YjbI with pentapeptide repeats
LWADLNQAVLIGAVLFEARLNKADLIGAILFGAHLIGADLSGADLTTARNLEQQQIDSAKGDDTTKLPSNLHKPEAWKKQ